MQKVMKILLFLFLVSFWTVSGNVRSVSDIDNLIMEEDTAIGMSAGNLNSNFTLDEDASEADEKSDAPKEEEGRKREEAEKKKRAETEKKKREEEKRQHDSKTADPKDPNIAAFINEWISHAEPSINATDCAKTRYESWGRAIGRTRTTTLQVTGKPDDAGGRSSAEYIWSMRNKLDSVDHCTLGEYVTARLENKSIAHCKGRYKFEKKNVNEVLGEGRKYWDQGQLDQAIQHVSRSQKEVCDDQKLNKALSAMKRQKSDIDKRLQKTSSYIHNDQLDNAENSLHKASRISSKYERYIEVKQDLEDAKKKLKEEKIAEVRQKVKEQAQRNVEARQRAKAEAQREEEERREVRKLAQEQAKRDAKARKRAEEQAKKEEEEKRHDREEKLSTSHPLIGHWKGYVKQASMPKRPLYWDIVSVSRNGKFTATTTSSGKKERFLGTIRGTKLSLTSTIYQDGDVYKNVANATWDKHNMTIKGIIIPFVNKRNMLPKGFSINFYLKKKIQKLDLSNRCSTGTVWSKKFGKCIKNRLKPTPVPPKINYGNQCPKQNPGNKFKNKFDTNNNSKDGTYILCNYFKDGALQYQAPYVNAKKHGIVLNHQNKIPHKLSQFATYKNGDRDGILKVWLTSENHYYLLRKIIYTDGKKRTSIQWHSNGKTRSETEYTDNGKAHLQYNYNKNGEPTYCTEWNYKRQPMDCKTKKIRY